MSSTNTAPSAETPDPNDAAALAAPLTEAVEAASSDVVAATDTAAAPDASDASVTPVAPAAQQPVPSTAATGARLAELFPALFVGAPKPLKLRIQVDIQERAPGEFSKQALSAFFRRHTGATSYLVAVSRGKQRFDLDGQPAGELSDEHRQLATEELTRRRANQQARRVQEDAQREQEEAGRRQRANLLRDFQSNRLTTANFCALKGIAPDQLEGLLAQARTEAQEDAARPRRPEHGRDDARRDHQHRNGPPRHNGPRADAEGGRRDDRGRPQGPQSRRGPGQGGGPSGNPGPGGRNERRGPPRG